MSISLLFRCCHCSLKFGCPFSLYDRRHDGEDDRKELIECGQVETKSRLYLIDPDEDRCVEDHLVIVKATSREDAIEKYGMRVGIKEKIFLIFVYDYRYGDGFASHFWDWAECSYGVRRVVPSFQEFSRRIRTFFGDRTDFAEIYLAYCRDDPVDESSAASWDDVVELYAVAMHIFSDEMLLYIWSHAAWHSTRAFLLDDIARFD